MTTTTDNLEYLKGRVDRLTTRVLEAEQRYIILFDAPEAGRDELDFARWEYELTLGKLGQALNEYVCEQNEVQRGIDKRMRRAA